MVLLSGEGGGKGRRVREEGLPAAASTRARARAHALFGFVVHTMNAMSGAMQFSRRWTSVVVPAAMLIKYGLECGSATCEEWRDQFDDHAVDSSTTLVCSAFLGCNVGFG